MIKLRRKEQRKIEKQRIKRRWKKEIDARKGNKGTCRKE
jgi:hypothetical protein